MCVLDPSLPQACMIDFHPILTLATLLVVEVHYIMDNISIHICSALDNCEFTLEEMKISFQIQNRLSLRAPGT